MRIISPFLAFFLVFFFAGQGISQTDYPVNTVHLFYGFPAGTDVVARLLADKFSQAWGKPVIVENVTGAGGNIAADRTAKAKNDGHFIGLLSGSSIVMSANLYDKLSFDPVKDFSPVTQVFKYPNVLVVNNDIPVKNVRELVAIARAQPGKLSFGHSGVGTTQHLSAELLKSMAKIDLQQVPYRGPAAIIPDLLSGRISMCFCNTAATLPLVQEGKLRALAVTSLARWPFSPDLPTMDEVGFSGFEAVAWFGLFVPIGTPETIVKRLHDETVRTLALTDVSNRLDELGVMSVGNSPAEFAAVIEAETRYWAKVIKESGAKISE